MPRAIISTSLNSAAGAAPVDKYFDRVVKYIPGDVVAGWVAADGVIKGSARKPSPAILWTVFGFGLCFCAAWTYKQVAKTNKSVAPLQALVSTLAFVVWVYALGGPFPDWLGWYNPMIGSLVLIGFSLGVGLIVPAES